MANLIAWIGVVLGIAMGGGIAFLFFRQRIHHQSGPTQAEGLFLSGMPQDGTASPSPSGSEPAAVAQAETKPALQPGPDEPEQTPSGGVKKSLSDRLRVPTGLQGNLTQVPVHDFLQFLAQGKRSGILEVISGRRHGYIKMSEGHIDHVVFRGRSGLNALFSLLGLTEGDFEFFEGDDAVFPASIEMGESHASLEVLDVLLRWEAQVKKPGSTENGAGEA